MQTLGHFFEPLYIADGNTSIHDLSLKYIADGSPSVHDLFLKYVTNGNVSICDPLFPNLLPEVGKVPSSKICHCSHRRKHYIVEIKG